MEDAWEARACDIKQWKTPEINNKTYQKKVNNSKQNKATRDERWERWLNDKQERELGRKCRSNMDFTMEPEIFEQHSTCLLACLFWACPWGGRIHGERGRLDPPGCWASPHEKGPSESDTSSNGDLSVVSSASRAGLRRPMGPATADLPGRELGGALEESTQLRIDEDRRPRTTSRRLGRTLGFSLIVRTAAPFRVCKGTYLSINDDHSLLALPRPNRSWEAEPGPSKVELLQDFWPTWVFSREPNRSWDPSGIIWLPPRESFSSFDRCRVASRFPSRAARGWSTVNALHCIFLSRVSNPQNRSMWFWPWGCVAWKAQAKKKKNFREDCNKENTAAKRVRRWSHKFTTRPPGCNRMGWVMGRTERDVKRSGQNSNLTTHKACSGTFGGETLWLAFCPLYGVLLLGSRRGYHHYHYHYLNWCYAESRSVAHTPKYRRNSYLKLAYLPISLSLPFARRFSTLSRKDFRTATTERETKPTGGYTLGTEERPTAGGQRVSVPRLMSLVFLAVLARLTLKQRGWESLEEVCQLSLLIMPNKQLPMICYRACLFIGVTRLREEIRTGRTCIYAAATIQIYPDYPDYARTVRKPPFSHLAVVKMSPHRAIVARRKKANPSALPSELVKEATHPNPIRVPCERCLCDLLALSLAVPTFLSSIDNQFAQFPFFFFFFALFPRLSPLLDHAFVPHPPLSRLQVQETLEPVWPSLALFAHGFETSGRNHDQSDTSQPSREEKYLHSSSFNPQKFEPLFGLLFSRVSNGFSPCFVLLSLPLCRPELSTKQGARPSFPAKNEMGPAALVPSGLSQRKFDVQASAPTSHSRVQNFGIHIARKELALAYAITELLDPIIRERRKRPDQHSKCPCSFHTVIPRKKTTTYPSGRSTTLRTTCGSCPTTSPTRPARRPDAATLVFPTLASGRRLSLLIWNAEICSSYCRATVRHLHNGFAPTTRTKNLHTRPPARRLSSSRSKDVTENTPAGCCARSWFTGPLPNCESPSVSLGRIFLPSGFCDGVDGVGGHLPSTVS
ncbi:hypothetical protein CCUS01_09966 [Colletotrichum cuscutae]|uniref:Uncharacterized protein n=1 Tax=Colletotrichum cuscutae TaxID=1209917 RepID=A0AAI9UDT0_9PEZI|nr:hypothetical protein CCUS01_09966 [Colletotrichum cuscutae]